MGSVVVEPVEVVTDVERRARILEAAALEIEVRGWSTSGLTTNRLFCWNDSRDTAEEVTFLLRWRAEEIRDGR